MKNAIANYKEAPVQMKAASDAYLQKSVVYRNGLADMVNVSIAKLAAIVCAAVTLLNV